MIGSGSFGHVFSCKNVKSGKVFALKKFKKKYANKKQAFDEREVKVLLRISSKADPCPYLLKAEKIEYENRKLYIIFEKMDMNLSDYIKKRGRKGLVRLDEQNEIKTIMR